MPILSGSYISSLHLIQYARNNYYLLSNSFEQKQSNSLQPVKMIQGTVGTRTMGVGGIVWDTTLNGDALIYRLNDNIPSTNRIADLLDIIIYEWSNFTITGGQQINNNVTSILEKATINITKDNVSCTADFKSDSQFAFNIIPNGVDARAITSGLISRTAKWYDCEVYFSPQPTGTNWYYNADSSQQTFAIESATINLSAEVAERYFINGTQVPYLNVNGYSISGSLTIVATLPQLRNLTNQIGYQKQIGEPGGYLKLTGPTAITLRVGDTTTNGRSLSLGTQSMLSVFNISVKSGDVMKFRIDFTSYTV